MKFWVVLMLSGALSFVPSGSERFLKVFRFFLTLQGCLEVFRRHLWRSHGFQAVLKRFPEGSEGYSDVIWWHFEVLSWIVSRSVRILSVERFSLMFLGVLRRSNSFCGVLMNYERFYNYCSFRF